MQNDNCERGFGMERDMRSFAINGFDKKLVLENGNEYFGFGFGYEGEVVSEIVFNTAMVGYHNVLADPAYANQSVVMGYPLIGNYGVAKDNYESITPALSGLIVREYNDLPNNFNSEKTLDRVMKENKVVGICGVDTRELTRFIRDNGSCKCIITDVSTTKEDAVEKINATELPENRVECVGCKYDWYYRTLENKYNIVVVDCGIKSGIVSVLNEKGCNVTVVPWNTTAEKIEFINPDGVLISSGPGNPKSVKETVELIKALKGKYPIAGIGLGFQLIALAYGADTYSLKVGHRGLNYPVRNLENGSIRITAQNHGYAVDAESLKGTGLTVSHENIVDKTVAGAMDKENKVFGIQFYPDRMPGIEEPDYFFDKFVEMLAEVK